MGELLDKLILFLCCVLLLPLQAFSPWCLAALLAALCLSSLNSYFPEKFSFCSSIGFLAAGCLRPEFFLFIPFLSYDLWRPCFRAVYLLLPSAVFFQLGRVSPLAMAVFFLYTGLSALLKLRTLALSRSRRDYKDLTDNAKEISLHLEQKNKELLEKQDYEIQVATLNERNRIAREIHDSVGHLLSRSILQLGALKAVHRQEPELNAQLDTLKSTLSQAMDSIRESVHDLHEESIDLRSQLETLCRGFTFCPISLQYDCGAMPLELKYCLIAIVREALSNIMRHYNATAAQVSAVEFPGFYQMIVQDNGIRQAAGDRAGIGLRNMEERLAAFHGNLTVSRKNGFRLFITIPKEDVHEAADY